MLLSKHDVFAMSDTELGETNLVEHTIDTGEAKPVKTAPRCLPYALLRELEEELIRLESTGEKWAMCWTNARMQNCA